MDIAAGQITATNAAGEKNVATNEQPVLGRKETKTAGAMARYFQNLEVGTEKISVWCFFDEKIWFDWLDFQCEPEIVREIAIRNHRRGERVTSDLRVKLAFNPGNVLYLCFTNEIIFATNTGALHHPFYGCTRGSTGTGEFERNGGDVRGPASRGRPLHPAKAQRGGFEEIPADVSGDARFQPSLFHAGRR